MKNFKSHGRVKFVGYEKQLNSKIRDCLAKSN